MVKVLLPVDHSKYKFYCKGVAPYTVGLQPFKVDTVLVKVNKSTNKPKVLLPYASAQKGRWWLRVRLGKQQLYWNKVVAWAFTHKDISWTAAFGLGNNYDGCHLGTYTGSELDYTRSNLALNTKPWNQRHYKKAARIRHGQVKKP